MTLVAECANILWKKVQRDELSRGESLLEAATRIAIELDHPAYDCLYLALAFEHDCRFITADQRLLHKLGKRHRSRFRGRVITLDRIAQG